jgi:hypothetical protein
MLLISNLVNGIDLYSFPTLQRIRHFDYVAKTNVPLQLCLARQALDWVVMGGDDGAARIYDRATGALVRTLRHSAKGLVQTVEVRLAI